MITIEQLLESVDLDFEPRWVTKDEEVVVIWEKEPIPHIGRWISNEVEDVNTRSAALLERLKLAEFDGKDWTECIYEVPRKVEITKIEEFTGEDFETIPDGHGNYKKVLGAGILDKLNTLVDAVNELKGAKNE